MKIKAAVGIAILCIGFLLFGMFVPISTETEEYLLPDLPEQYMDTKQEWEEMQSAFSLLKALSGSSIIKMSGCSITACAMRKR